MKSVALLFDNFERLPSCMRHCPTIVNEEVSGRSVFAAFYCLLICVPSPRCSSWDYVTGVARSHRFVFLACRKPPAQPHRWSRNIGVAGPVGCYFPHSPDMIRTCYDLINFTTITLSFLIHMSIIDYLGQSYPKWKFRIVVHRTVK